MGIYVGEVSYGHLGGQALGEQLAIDDQAEARQKLGDRLDIPGRGDVQQLGPRIIRQDNPPLLAVQHDEEPATGYQLGRDLGISLFDIGQAEQLAQATRPDERTFVKRPGRILLVQMRRALVTQASRPEQLGRSRRPATAKLTIRFRQLIADRPGARLLVHILGGSCITKTTIDTNGRMSIPAKPGDGRRPGRL